MAERPKQRVQQRMKGVGKKRGREEGRRQKGKKEENEKKKNAAVVKEQKGTEL